ncbi:ubiquitin-specific protease ubp15, partial [Friedmanniomyces endolithicus]
RQAGTTVSTILFGTSGNYGGGGYSYNSSATAQAPDHLFYEVLEMTLTDLEQRKAIRIIWLSDGINKETAYEMAMPKQSLFSDILAALQKRAGLPDEVVQHVRFYEAHGNKVYKVLPLTHSVVALNEYMTVYAERIPAEEEAE